MCEQDYENKKIGDYKIFIFFCKRLTQIFVLVRTGQYTYCEIDRKLLHITFLIPVQLRNTTLLVLFTFNYEDNNLRLRSVDGTQQISG